MIRLQKFNIKSVAFTSAGIMFLLGLFAGLLYAITGTFFGATVTSIKAPIGESFISSILFGILAVVIVTIIYTLIGLIFGSLFALIYNLVSKYTGGIRLHLK